MVEGNKWSFQIVEIGVMHVVMHGQMHTNKSAAIMASGTVPVHVLHHVVYAVSLLLLHA